MYPKFLIVLILAIISTIFTYAELQQKPDPSISQEEMEAYYGKLQDQIQIQEAKVENYIKHSSRQQVPSQIKRVEFQHLMVMLDVKKNLYGNFYGTESLRKSAAIRQALLKIMSKDTITVADLAALQNLVSQEKARLGIPQT